MPIVKTGYLHNFLLEQIKENYEQKNKITKSLFQTSSG